MSRFFKTGMAALSATILSTALAATIASAADLDLPAPVIEHNSAVAVGGFYLRGDIGYSIWKDPEITDTVGGGVSENFGEDSGNSLLAGVGVGYKFNKYLRSDVTFDIRKAKNTRSFAPCGTCLLAGLPGFTTSNFSSSTYTVLANAYVDLFEYRRFTPYIGGGIGAAYIDRSRLISTGNPPPQAPTDTFAGDDGFRFAWAINAGTSYAVNDNLSLDLSYRYLNISDGRIADITFGGTDFGDVNDDGLDGHEFRFGFRYTFGGGKSYDAPEPIFK